MIQRRACFRRNIPCVATCEPLAFKNAMIQFNTEVLGDFLHLYLHLVLHTTPSSEELLEFAGIEDDIASK